ncbi:MAG: hypothetical protein GF353_16845 [Candidatus Lokiarchaeota archaeon]|nr:hypothetical protein [Candidatus Lokiarchaeota archaeon]
MILTPIEIIMATFSLIIVTIFSLVGISIALKYRNTNDKVYLLVGLTWIGIIEAWVPSGIVLIGSIITNSLILSKESFLIIAIAGYPLSTFIWITAIAEILYWDKKKLIQIIFGVGGAIYEIVFLSVLFTDVSLIAAFKSPVDVSYQPIVSVYILIALIIILLTGLIISINSIKDNIPQNKLRGYFLLAALTTLFIGGLLDAAADLDLLGIVLVRLFVISSAIEFYFAFVMPNFIKRIFKIS